jgi:hypothetical protein
MPIKRDKDGYAIDTFTNTPEDAAWFERTYNSHLHDDHTDDIPDDFEPEDTYEEDPCKCSDPGCPCTGAKRGWL